MVLRPSIKAIHSALERRDSASNLFINAMVSSINISIPFAFSKRSTIKGCPTQEKSQMEQPHISLLLLHHSFQGSPYGLVCFYYSGLQSGNGEPIPQTLPAHHIFHYKYKSLFFLLRFRINLTTSTMIRTSRARTPAPMLKIATAIRLGFFITSPRLPSSLIFLRPWDLL